MATERDDALEACAREIVHEVYGDYPAAFAVTKAILAIMESYGLRGPNEVSESERHFASMKQIVIDRARTTEETP